MASIPVNLWITGRQVWESYNNWVVHPNLWPGCYWPGPVMKFSKFVAVQIMVYINQSLHISLKLYIPPRNDICKNMHVESMWTCAEYFSFFHLSSWSSNSLSSTFVVKALSWNIIPHVGQHFHCKVLLPLWITSTGAKSGNISTLLWKRW